LKILRGRFDVDPCQGRRVTERGERERRRMGRREERGEQGRRRRATTT